MSNKELIDKLLKASEIIHKSSMRGGANYIVTSPSVSQMINRLYNERANDRKEKIIRIFNEEV